MALADRLRVLPWHYQALVFFLVFAVVVVSFEYLSVSPVSQAREHRNQLEQRYQALVAEVSRLQAVKQQHQEFRTRLQALEEQLARSQTFVPAEKRTDEFLRLLHTSALTTHISLRRLTSRPVVMREFYAEMPFEIQLDGPYYDIMEFFNRLGRTARIVNAGGLHLEGVDTTRNPKYTYLPGTTVSGVSIVTTFYTPSEAELAAAAPPTAQRAPAPGAQGTPAPAQR